MKSVSIIAVKESTELVEKEILNKGGKTYSHDYLLGKTDTWFVNSTYLYTKAQRRLNKKLGLWSINMDETNMSRI